MVLDEYDMPHIRNYDYVLNLSLYDIINDQFNTESLVCIRIEHAARKFMVDNDFNVPDSYDSIECESQEWYNMLTFTNLCKRINTAINTLKNTSYEFHTNVGVRVPHYILPPDFRPGHSKYPNPKWILIQLWRV